MIVNESMAKKWKVEKDFDEILVLYLENLNIRKINLKMFDFKTLIFVSVRNNNLKNIDFINLMGNLWYLDLRNNAVKYINNLYKIEDLDPINRKKTFGFLGLTFGIYTSKIFFELKMLNLGILKIEGITFDECLKHLTSYFSNVLQINDTSINYAMYIHDSDYLERKTVTRKKSFLRASFANSNPTISNNLNFLI